ncbi:hypothetical protein I6J18_22845 [Peribacillus psychrosaccharolyticus]|uniref:Uncharacterized protein n=2 Tax=Peribacillus psychrosaccharolyticus TaxID=1407 RepID=A0A974NRR6_PERPY|nr:hypothetical protein [Peribacillus psychrosaccharolyticus]MED3745618.1 hypothetical protein [Peribacillus psychrosaccharolyticus]QQT02807.1 hypothetical protein I6J18_22845 [Peribacillus psychrosaccharolyticus]
MKFIELKNKRAEKVGCKISERNRSIVKYYTEYTEFTEEEVVDEFLLNLLDNKKFLKCVEGKRYNKRILAQLFDTEDDANLALLTNNLP